MRRQTALLGSINVGGNRLKMAELMAAMRDAGFAGVETVGASGNLLFAPLPLGDSEIAARIEAIVAARFAISSFAAVRSRDEIAEAISANPFASDGEAKFVHTVFLEHPIERSAVEAFARDFDGPERIAAGKRELYIDYAVGAGRSQIDPALRKARLIKGRATARNIRSLARIRDRLDK